MSVYQDVKNYTERKADEKVARHSEATIVGYTNKTKSGVENRLRFLTKANYKEKIEEKVSAGTATVARARGREECGERAVFIKAEQKRNDNGQSTAAEDIRTENAVLRAEDK